MTAAVGENEAAGTLAVMLARVEGKLDAISREYSVRLVALENRALDHETRLRSTERKVWLAAGFAATLAGGAASAVTNLLGT